MIWLRKYQNDTQANSTTKALIKYFQDGTESFEQYYTRICNSPNENKDDIIFHLDQLIDIAIHCKLLSDWFSKLTQKDRINYFLQLNSIDFIKENADYHYHFSQNRLDEAGEKVIAILNNSFNEFSVEFCKKLTPYVNDVAKLGLFKPKYPTTCFWVSQILQSNLLAHIRLSPRPYVIYQHENCNFSSNVPDFVNYPLFRVDDNYQPKEAIEDTTIELQNLSNECFDDFMKLAMFYVYKNQGAKSEQVTINIQQNINNPEFNFKTFSSVYHNETFNFECEKEKQSDINYTENDISNNEDFKTFCNLSPGFYKIWECLSSKGFWIYDGKFIQRNEDTFPEYCLNLLAHEESLLNVSFKVAHPYFKKLFNYTDINDISVPNKYNRSAWLEILKLITNFLEN